MPTTARHVALRAGLLRVATAAALAGTFLTTANTAAAAQPDRAVAAANAPRPVASAMLKSGEKLTADEEIKSANGKYTLLDQRGELLRSPSAGRPA